jgi:hypothetical protein
VGVGTLEVSTGEFDSPETQLNALIAEIDRLAAALACDLGIQIDRIKAQEIKHQILACTELTLRLNKYLATFIERNDNNLHLYTRALSAQSRLIRRSHLATIALIQYYHRSKPDKPAIL